MVFPQPIADHIENTQVREEPDASYKILVPDNLATIPKQSGVQGIIRSVKNDLTDIETQLNSIDLSALAKGEIEHLYQSLAKNLQRLEDVVGSVVEYLPPYEQRLVQSKLGSIGRLLAEKRNHGSVVQGFSFRKPKVLPKKAALNESFVDVPDVGITERCGELSLRDEFSSPLDSCKGSQANIPKDMVNHKAASKSHHLCVLNSLTDAVIVLDRTRVTDKDVLLKDLMNCRITIQGCASTVRFESITNCTLVCGPVRSSVFVSKCHNCTVAVACQQLRVHESSDLSCYVHLTSGGIIEDTKNISFAPYQVSYPGLDADFVEAGLSRDPNENWQKIEDFDFVVSKRRSPNWTVIPETDRISFNLDSNSTT